MNKEEKIIQGKFGKDCHFTVPESYFEQLTQHVMEQLPEPEAKVIPFVPKWHKFRTAIMAAACSLIAVAGISFYFHENGHSSSNTINMAVFDSDANSYSFAMDEAVDYAMIDNNDIYASLEDANY